MIDKELGNFLKVDRHKYVRIARILKASSQRIEARVV